MNLIQGVRVRENLARFTVGQQTPESLYIGLKSQRSMVDTNIRYKYRAVIKYSIIMYKVNLVWMSVQENN